METVKSGEAIPGEIRVQENETQVVDIAVVLPWLQEPRVVFRGLPPPGVAGSLGDEPHHAGVEPAAPVGPAFAGVLPASVLACRSERSPGRARRCRGPVARRNQTRASSRGTSACGSISRGSAMVKLQRRKREDRGMRQPPTVAPTPGIGPGVRPCYIDSHSISSIKGTSDGIRPAGPVRG